MKLIISILLILTILVASCATVKEDANTKVFPLDKKYKECQSARLYEGKYAFVLLDNDYYQHVYYDGYISARKDIRIDFTTFRVFDDGTIIYVAEKEVGEMVLVSNNDGIIKPEEQDFNNVIQEYSKKSSLVSQDTGRSISCEIKGNQAVIRLG